MSEKIDNTARLRDALEALAREWASKPYTGDYTQAVYQICASELREVLEGANAASSD